MQTKQQNTLKETERNFLKLLFTQENSTHLICGVGTKRKVIDAINLICFPTKSGRYNELEISDLLGGLDLRAFNPSGVPYKDKMVFIRIFDIASMLVVSSHQLMIHFKDNETKTKIANFRNSLILKIIDIVYEEMYSEPMSFELRSVLDQIFYDNILESFSPEKSKIIQDHWHNSSLNCGYYHKYSLDHLRKVFGHMERCYEKTIELCAFIDKNTANNALNQFKERNNHVLDEYRKSTKVENVPLIKISLEVILGCLLLYVLPFPLSWIGMCIMTVLSGYSYQESQNSSSRKMNNQCQKLYAADVWPTYINFNKLKFNLGVQANTKDEIEKMNPQTRAKVCAKYKFAYYQYLGGIVEVKDSPKAASQKNRKPQYTMRYLVQDYLISSVSTENNLRKNYLRDKEKKTPKMEKTENKLNLVNKNSPAYQLTGPLKETGRLVTLKKSMAFFNLDKFITKIGANTKQQFFADQVSFGSAQGDFGIFKPVKNTNPKQYRFKLFNGMRIDFQKQHNNVEVIATDGSKKSVPEYRAIQYGGGRANG